MAVLISVDSRGPVMLPIGRNIIANITNLGPGVCFLDSTPSLSALNNDAVVRKGEIAGWLPFVDCWAIAESGSTCTLRISQNIRL